MCPGDSLVLHSSGDYPIKWYYNGIIIPGEADSTLTVFATGNFYSSDSNVCGISFSNIISVALYSVSNPSIIFSNDTLFASGSFSSYQWFQDSILIPGANSSFFVPDTTGSYTVVVTDNNGCGSDSSLFVVVTNQFSLNKHSDIILYPNPSDGIFSVLFPKGKKIEAITISNATGQKIFSAQTQIGSSLNVDLSQYPAATYSIQIVTATNIYFSKLIIVK